jgi:outer membrane protein assembly factor BamB
MNLSKFTCCLLSLGYSVSAFPFAEIKLVTSHPEILEVVGAYSPGPVGSFSTRPTVVIPYQKTFSQFGGLTADNAFTFEMQKKIKEENSKNSLINKSKISILPRPVCGPSPETNTINCFDLNRSGQYLQSYPIPGSVSSTPIFYDNHWLIGTNKGYLLKVEANTFNNYLPFLGSENTSLWGTYSRKYMAIFRPKPIYKDQSGAANNLNYQELIKETLLLSPGMKWVFSNSSKFVGTPIIQNGNVYIFSANEYIQAFNWETGKLSWAVRLAPDANLRLTSNALTSTPTEIIVGTNLGAILILNPKTGSIEWSWQVQEATDSQRESTQLPAGPDKFNSIVSTPLVIDRNLIVSNTESMTQNISLDSKSAIWSYPLGSVAQPKLYQNSVLIGSSNGKLVSLNKETGEVLWSTSLTYDLSPIMSVFVTKKNVILAASSRGQIFMVDPNNGKILSQNLPIGETNGEFFAGYDKADACISFSQNGFRCFYAKVK